MNVLVLGGSGGIGRAIIDEISRRYPRANIFATWHHNKPKKLVSDAISAGQEEVQWFKSDISSESQVKDLSANIQNSLRDISNDSSASGNFNITLDWIINAVGFLHANGQLPEKSLRQFDPGFFIKNISLNTLPTLILAKHFSALIRQCEAPVFATVSAKVGSIEDNGLGGWTSYRCSKAALNMALKNISLEWKRSIPKACVVALHPGTTDTELSLPFQSNVPVGKLFSRQKTAGYLVDVIETLTPEKTGKFFSWDKSEIPW